MLKYTETKVTFAEVPDEITLCINITNCPNRCKGCHSTYLQMDIGNELTLFDIAKLISTNEGITCICLMGGDANPKDIDIIAKDIKKYFNIKVAWYSGKDEISDDINPKNFNYIKIGHYDEDKGPLNSKTTNQIMYKVHNKSTDYTPYKEVKLEDITYKFQNINN